MSFSFLGPENEYYLLIECDIVQQLYSYSLVSLSINISTDKLDILKKNMVLEPFYHSQLPFLMFYGIK